MTDIVERLREQDRGHPDADVLPFREAADTITALRAEVEALRGVCVVAAIPLEALIMSGGDAAHCQDVRDAIHDAVKTIRAALKEPT